MICITATEEKFSRKYLGGKWQALQNEAGNKGYEIKNGGLGKCFEFPANEVDLSMADFLELNDDGFTIHNWPCFLSLDATKYSDPVPAGIPDRIIINEDETETVKTWAQWGSTSHVDLTDGTKGISLVYNSTACTNAECATMYGLEGCTLLNEVDYRALLPVAGGA
jgi:hypothetical protein